MVENLGFTNYPVLLEWVLSFGSSVEVLAPERLREEIKREAARILQNYCNVEDNRACYGISRKAGRNRDGENKAGRNKFDIRERM